MASRAREEHRWCIAPRAEDRLEAALRFLDGLPPGEGALLLGATVEAVAALARRRGARRPGLVAVFGEARMSLGTLAGRLAAQPLAEEGRVVASGLAVEALVARIVHQLGPEGLGRFAPVAEEPGLPRALCRTLRDLRLAGVSPEAIDDPDLPRLLAAFERGLAEEGIADRALAYEVARQVVVGERPGAEDALDLVGQPIVLLDARIAHRREAELVVALVERGGPALATLPAGERRAARLLEEAFGALPVAPEPGAAPSAAGGGTGAPGAGPRPRREGAGKARPALRPPLQLSLFEPPPAPSWAPDEPIREGPLGPEPAGPPSGEQPAPATPATDLHRLQTRLFQVGPGEAAPPPGTAEPRAPRGDGTVEVFSAPGEHRECVEIARRIVAEAEGGTPFDRIAVLLRAPELYRIPIEEALARAEVPFVSSRGSRRPNPDGRGLLALLACAAEGLSARAFAEYLSLGVLPPPEVDGAPPAVPPEEARWVAPDDELVPVPEAEAEPSESGDGITDDPAPPAAAIPRDGDGVPLAAVSGGGFRSPRRWEQLLVDAAVVGGRDRWARRLDGLDAALAKDHAELLAEDPEDPRLLRLARRRTELAALRAFALPLLDQLAALPEAASWGEWLDALSSLAHAAVRHPASVQRVLAELAPMAPVGPVGLDEVRLVLEERLTELTEPAPGDHPGAVRVAALDEARGLSFPVVFLPGLAERVFPQKVVEDPVLLDARRSATSPDLAVNESRVEDERLALRVGVGAAEARLVLSYPRVETERARPRVPSFYGLEVLRAVTGRLPSFEELGREAEAAGRARMGWPAPASPEQAIDHAEYDLAVLRRLVERPREARRGAARYLLDASPHLRRALRFRARRWRKTFTAVDGLVDPPPGAAAALARHRLDARPFSPTALESFAHCPYRFFLRAILKLSPRETPESVDELDPLQRGRLIHEAQLRLLEELRREGLLTLPDDARVADALARLDEVVRRVAEAYAEELVPAIDRVFQDGVDEVRADLREWLRRVAQDPWRPALFELAFGLPGAGRDRDPASRREPVALPEGLLLRGSIDLVEERAEALRATDHKTGKAWVSEDVVIDGGTALQPVLYALVLEQLFPDRPVEAGRLFYCTSRGDFAERVVPLDETARGAVRRLVQVIGGALEDGFLPAAPARGACARCDYASVCGPHEERRLQRKNPERLDALRHLRETP